MSSIINKNINTNSNLNNISDRTKSQLEDNIEIDKKVLKRSEIYPHFFSR